MKRKKKFKVVKNVLLGVLIFGIISMFMNYVTKSENSEKFNDDDDEDLDFDDFYDDEDDNLDYQEDEEY